MWDTISFPHPPHHLEKISMHIAHFTNSYLPVINGVVRSVSAYRKTLTELGHNVFVFAQEDDYEDQAPFIFRYPSIPIPVDVDIPAAIPISPFIDQLIPHLKLDVVHTHHPILLGQVAASKAHELNLPLVFTFHTQYREYTHYVPFSQESVQEFLKTAVHNWLQDFVQQCNHIVIPSESMRDILLKDYGLESRYTVIPTGIELEPYQIEGGVEVRKAHGWQADRLMISTGRLAQEKNWETLIQAAKLVLQEYPDFRLVIVGDGPHHRELQAFVAELGLADRIQFLGWTPFEEVPALLKAADLFGYASTTETQGIVTMEALAAGLPVVAVDASGTRDIVQHGEQGLLVENDPAALAKAICQILGDEQLYARLQAATQKRAKAFEMKTLAAKLVTVYEQAIVDKEEGQFVQVTKN